MRDFDQSPMRVDGEGAAGLSRRDFVKGVGAAGLTLGAAAAVPILGAARALADSGAKVGPTPKAPAETAVARFYQTLKAEQKKAICFPFNHPKRRMVNNNWKIVNPSIGDLTNEQQAICQEIFKNLCSEEGYERFNKQMTDDYGGFDAYHVAMFGEPGTDQPFEWVLSGRHDTLRADGNSVEGAAFGGPIFYGHAANGNNNEDPTHKANVWWYQAQQANKIYASLDDKQKAKALVSMGKADPDTPRSIQLKGDKLGAAGLLIADLDSQQKEMVQKLLKDLTSPFRAFDVEEVRACLRDAGGVDKLRLTFYKDGDIGNDGVWDIWKLEGPAFVWYFHGSPHVHTWVNIASKAGVYEPPPA